MQRQQALLRQHRAGLQRGVAQPVVVVHHAGLGRKHQRFGVFNDVPQVGAGHDAVARCGRVGCSSWQGD